MTKWWLISALAISQTLAVAGGPRTGGTFVQLNRAVAARGAQAWEDDFAQMARLGIGTIIVQWCAEESISYFTNNLAFEEQYGAVDAILAAAEKSQMDVHLGLQHDPYYWRQISGRDSVLKDYFLIRVSQNEALQKELLLRFANHPNWKGYYLPDEIDDLNWRAPGKGAFLNHYLRQMGDRLRANDSQRRILVSAFYRMRTAPEVFAANMGDLLAGSRIDALLVQDGLGDGISWKYAERYAPAYYQALRDAFAREGPETWCVIETFARTSAATEPFAAAPATPERVQRQIALAQPFFKTMIYFTFADYMDPDLGPEAAGLYKALAGEKAAEPAGAATQGAPAPAPKPEDK